MPDAHALLSPSASSRWLHCTPCALMEARLPSKETVYTREGTLAHAMGEWILKTYIGDRTEEDLDEIRETAAAEGFDSVDMERTVRSGYAEKVLAEYEALRETDPAAHLFIETRVVMGDYAPDCWGTSDAIIFGNKTLHVCDYKHGKGVRVEAKDNTQMMLYALGAYLTIGVWLCDIERVQMTIYQPRLNHWSTASMDLEDLLTWAENILKPAAEKASAGLGDQTPGKWCRFCRCAGQCGPLAAFSRRAALESFDPQLMTSEEVAESLAVLPVVQAWCNSVSAFALQELTEGRTLPGWKLVAGRAATKITDSEGAARALKARGFEDSQIYGEPSLQGLTALKKLLGKKEFDTILSPFLTKSSGKPTVVPDDDPRPALGKEDAADVFNDIPDNTNF